VAIFAHAILETTSAHAEVTSAHATRAAISARVPQAADFAHAVQLVTFAPGAIIIWVAAVVATFARAVLAVAAISGRARLACDPLARVAHGEVAAVNYAPTFHNEDLKYTVQELRSNILDSFNCPLLSGF